MSYISSMNNCESPRHCCRHNCCKSLVGIMSRTDIILPLTQVSKEVARIILKFAAVDPLTLSFGGHIVLWSHMRYLGQPGPSQTPPFDWLSQSGLGRYKASYGGLGGSLRLLGTLNTTLHLHHYERQQGAGAPLFTLTPSSDCKFFMS